MAEEKKKLSTGKLVGLGCLGLIVLVIIIAATSGGGKKETTQQTTQPTKTETKKEIKTVKTGEEVQVGEVKWVVQEVKKQNDIWNDFQKVKASGVFVVLKLKAELLGKDSGTIDSNQLKIIDSKDREFSYSMEGQTALISSGKEGLFLKQVNPNVPVTGYVVFDVATDAQGLKLKINDLRLLSTEYAFVDLGI
jgi:hypothetical protein